METSQESLSQRYSHKSEAFKNDEYDPDKIVVVSSQKSEIPSPSKTGKFKRKFLIASTLLFSASIALAIAAKGSLKNEPINSKIDPPKIQKTTKSIAATKAQGSEKIDKSTLFLLEKREEHDVQRLKETLGLTNQPEIVRINDLLTFLKGEKPEEQSLIETFSNICGEKFATMEEVTLHVQFIMGNWADSVDEIDRQQIDYEKQLEVFTQKLSQAKSEGEEDTIEIAALELDIKRLHTKYKERIKNLVHQNNIFKLLAQEKNSEVSIFLENLKTYEETIISLRNQLTKLEKELVIAQSDDSIFEPQPILSNELEKNEKIKNLKTALIQIQKQYEILKIKYDKLKKSQIELMETSIGINHSEALKLEKAQKQIKYFDIEKTELTRVTDELNSKILSLEEQNKSLVTKLSELNIKFYDQVATISTQAEKISVQTTTIADLSGEKNQLTKENTELKLNLEEALAQIFPETKLIPIPNGPDGDKDGPLNEILKGNPSGIFFRNGKVIALKNGKPTELDQSIHYTIKSKNGTNKSFKISELPNNNGSFFLNTENISIAQIN